MSQILKRTAGAPIRSVLFFALAVFFFTGEAVAGKVIKQWATDSAASSAWGTSDCTGNWCGLDAAGEPNIFVCGDSVDAWAPYSIGNDPEWLYLTYVDPVYATKVVIYETWNVGSVVRVTLIDVDGNESVVWEDVDETICPGVLEVSFPMTHALIKRVLVDTQIDGWEEIDAVALIGENSHGQSVVQWAEDVSTSAAWGEAWAVSQLEGGADTFTCGDSPSAWAPSDGGNATEFVEAYFAIPVYACAVTVYENWFTPFVYQVDLIDTHGGEHTVWKGEDTTTCPGELEILFSETSYRVEGVRIHTQVAGFEEIDAVQLLGHSRRVRSGGRKGQKRVDRRHAKCLQRSLEQDNRGGSGPGFYTP